MKKIFKILVLISVISIIRINGVKAETFYEDNWISGVYANLVDGDFSKPQQMRFIRRRSDNKAVYCLTPRDTIYETENYNKYDNNNLDIFNMSYEKYSRITQIAYFGYGYTNHTSDDWYAITQFMIWKEMEPNMDIFFTDKFKGNRISKFENEINEIESLISNYTKLPNIANLKLLPNTEYEIEDPNHLINKYDVIINDGLDVTKNNNILKIKTNDIGEYRIVTLMNSNIYYNNPVLYKANQGQDILMKGDIPSKQYDINVSVSKAKLIINKKDLETDKDIKGAKYNLYDVDYNYINTIITDTNGNAVIDNLLYGDYVLKEEEAPYGYKKDEFEHYIKVDKEEINLNLVDIPIKTKLIINKTLNDDNIKSIEKNIKFNIYDLNDNLIESIVTNEMGIAETKLSYGKYKIVQENTTLGYEKVKDFYIEVKNEEDIILNLEDKVIKANLKIIKKDLEIDKIILDETSFKIKDLNKNIYLDNEKIYKTENGIVELDIKYGKYLLEEVNPPINYIKGKNIEFNIDENSSDKTIELDVYNTRKKGRIKIIKYGKLLNNNIKLLDNIMFNIYDIDNNLVDTVTTNINGEALSKELELGKYYIIETSTLKNFILDKTKYEIELIDNQNDDLIISEIKIINNEKEKYYCKKIDNKYYDFLGNIVDEEEYKKSCLEQESNEIIEKNSAEDLDITEKLNEVEALKQTIYPKTSNIEIYIYTIISYLLLIGLMLIISSIKNEK